MRQVTIDHQTAGKVCHHCLEVTFKKGDKAFKSSHKHPKYFCIDCKNSMYY